MDRFDHEKLEVYEQALRIVILSSDIIQCFPKGRAYLSDQLQRAATSIPLNIAEGAGEFSSGDKARFNRIARRSAAECAAILDICRRLDLADATKLEQGRVLLLGIVRMLTRMVRNRAQGNLGAGRRAKGQGQG